MALIRAPRATCLVRCSWRSLSNARAAYHHHRHSRVASVCTCAAHRPSHLCRPSIAHLAHLPPIMCTLLCADASMAGVHLDCEKGTLKFTVNGKPGKASTFKDLPKRTRFYLAASFGGDDVAGASLTMLPSAGGGGGSEAAASPTAGGGGEEAGGEKVTVSMGADDFVDEVSYNGQSIRHLVSQAATAANEVKTFSFEAVPGAVLAIAANDNEPGTSAAFFLKCTSSYPSSGWHNLQLRPNHPNCKSFGTAHYGGKVGSMGRPKEHDPPHGWETNAFDDSHWKPPTAETHTHCKHAEPQTLDLHLLLRPPCAFAHLEAALTCRADQAAA